MFNLLIAFMSDIFVRMSQNGRSQWRLMQAKTVLEAGFLISAAHRKIEQISIISPKLVHVLMRTSDMDMDSLKASYEQSDTQSISSSIIGHNQKVHADLQAKALNIEDVMMTRLVAQQEALSEMVKLVEELISNPTGRHKEGTGKEDNVSRRSSASTRSSKVLPEPSGSVRL